MLKGKRFRRHEGVHLPPPPRTQALVDMAEVVDEYRRLYRTDSKIALVPREFYDRVERCWHMNGIPTTPTLMIQGQRLMAVAKVR